MTIQSYGSTGSEVDAWQQQLAEATEVQLSISTPMPPAPRNAAVQGSQKGRDEGR